MKPKQHGNSRLIMSYLADVRRNLQFEAVRCEREAARHAIGSLDSNILLDRAATLITVARCLNFDFDEDTMRPTSAGDNHASMAAAKTRIREEEIKDGKHSYHGELPPTDLALGA